MSGLENAYSEFWDELLLEATSTQELQATAFFDLYAETAAENGDCGDLEYCPVRKDGSRGYQLDGYALDVEIGELVLVICDFRDEREVQPLDSSKIKSIFGKVRRFFDNSCKKEFVGDLEETSYEFQAGYLILQHRAHIKRVRIIIFSNARIAIRKNILTSDQRNGLKFSYSILDFERYIDIQKSRAGGEPIMIELEELNSKPLPCLSAHSGSDEYASYLVAVPGELLAEVYGMYGARLLEQNVRTFLQARTKVNKGIIETIKNSPKMFFAYNNGLTATASSIEAVKTPNGNLGIVSLSNLQIVNGGQTTASILYARDKEKADLSNVFVQMKLSVVDSNIIEEVVPKISRFANTQNRVSEADFFSSHPFHLEMEKISRRLTAPASEGALTGSKWFYERARGQYRDKQAYMPDGRRKRFQLEFPKTQVIVKTDLAKYQTAFECKPWIVCRGAQKCFLEFATATGKKWASSPGKFNEGYFKNAVATAILFKWTDKMIEQSDWYRSERGYKAQIVAYTVSWLIDRIIQEKKSSLDLRSIWNKQGLPPSLKNILEETAPQVAKIVRDAPDEIKNVGEYSKRELCWSAIQKRVGVSIGARLKGSLIDISSVTDEKKDDRAIQKIDSGIDFDVKLLRLASIVEEIESEAERRGLKTHTTDKALKKIQQGKINLTRQEKSAMKKLLNSLAEIGFELPDLE
jgi:hypothetical protein